MKHFINAFGRLMKEMEAEMAELKRTTGAKKSAAAAHPPVVAKPANAPGEKVASSLEALAAMGGGEVAYIRAFRAAELRAMFPQTAQIHPAVQLYALFAADGTPLMLADTRDAVLNGAWQNDLTMTALH